MLVLALKSGYTRYSSLSLWYFLELVNVGGCSKHARHSSLFLARGRLSIRTPSRLHDWKKRRCGTVQIVRREITTRRPPCFDHMYTSWSVCFRWDQMCNVLVLRVTSSPPRHRMNSSCLLTDAVEPPRPSICLARESPLAMRLFGVGRTSICLERLARTSQSLVGRSDQNPDVCGPRY